MKKRLKAVTAVLKVNGVEVTREVKPLRDRRICLSEYRKLMSDLRKMAEEIGFRVRITRRAVISYGDFHVPSTSGWCMVPERTLRLAISGRPARRNVLHALAHEIRHALHVAEGLYRDYYKERPAAGSPHFVPYDLKVAEEAEQDCNDWADRWLRLHGLKPYCNVYGPYTMAYYANLEHEAELERNTRLGIVITPYEFKSMEKTP